jgi:DNA-binding XRE family transcriptional regulator
VEQLKQYKLACMVRVWRLGCQEKSGDKMGKSLGVSERIYDLRTKRGETQAQFAAAVGVTQQSISDWESETGDAVPSAESYVRLGNLAPYPDCLWFWDQAGMNQDAMLSAATKLLQERGDVPESKMIAVPRFQVATRTTEKNRPHYVDATLVPNPGSVAYWVVDTHVRAPDQLPLNRVVLLDTSANDAADRELFWDKDYFVEVAPVPLRHTGERDPSTASGSGLYIGRLTCSVTPGVNLEHAPWHAVLWHGQTGGRHEWSPPFAASIDSLPGSHDGIALGRWTISMTTDRSRLKKPRSPGSPYVPDFDKGLVEARAREELRLYPNCTILGRVLGWELPEQGK